MITRALLFAAVVCTILLTANAQHGHQHRHEPQEKASTKLGRINFCVPAQRVLRLLLTIAE
ncbi:MAG TPA: hypothetical protein VGC73_00605 [Pyrinomonadaceae bacterium]|jgi:hypothetical protein